MKRFNFNNEVSYLMLTALEMGDSETARIFHNAINNYNQLGPIRKIIVNHKAKKYINAIKAGA